MTKSFGFMITVSSELNATNSALILDLATCGFTGPKAH